MLINSNPISFFKTAHLQCWTPSDESSKLLLVNNTGYQSLLKTVFTWHPKEPEYVTNWDSCMCKNSWPHWHSPFRVPHAPSNKLSLASRQRPGVGDGSLRPSQNLANTTIWYKCKHHKMSPRKNSSLSYCVSILSTYLGTWNLVCQFLHTSFHTSRCLNQIMRPARCTSRFFSVTLKNTHSIQPGQTQPGSLRVFS